MTNWKFWAGQLLCYSLFIGFIGYFSNSPAYQRFPDNQAMIKLSLRHAGQLIGECHIRSEAELAQLPPNMRIAKVCPRERSSLMLDLLINGEIVYSEEHTPRGLHKDGLSSIYFRLPVDAGNIDFKVRMKDHPSQNDYPYQLQKKLQLAPAQVLVIDFDSKAGEFIIL
ncbi:MAG: hypothetical protein QNK32_00515 [Porticoccus sp.]|nr:hypothetical protein [Porticoccus sp.]